MFEMYRKEIPTGNSNLRVLGSNGMLNRFKVSRIDSLKKSQYLKVNNRPRLTNKLKNNQSFFLFLETAFSIANPAPKSTKVEATIRIIYSAFHDM